MEFDRPRRDTGSINLTPVIDMVFLLLIFFLLTSSYMKTEGIPVDLPGADAAATEQAYCVTVCIAAGGDLFIGRTATTLPTLEGDLRAACDAAGTRKVVIRADKANSIQMLVQVMEAATGAGAENLTLATVKESGGGTGT